MKPKATAKGTVAPSRPRAPKKRAHAPHHPEVACLHRSGPSEFSCGFDDTRALTVEESLDERERRG